MMGQENVPEGRTIGASEKERCGKVMEAVANDVGSPISKYTVRTR
jgi:hypothetical protein